MTLYTSYLGFTNRKDYAYCLSEMLGMQRAVKIELVYVMRNRGNLPVEPPKMVLYLFKDGAINWKAYEDAYLDSLKIDQSSWVWMEHVVSKASDHDVVLVCYEKDVEHCHRRLLAEFMQEHYGVPYLGELK